MITDTITEWSLMASCSSFSNASTKSCELWIFGYFNALCSSASIDLPLRSSKYKRHFVCPLCSYVAALPFPSIYHWIFGHFCVFRLLWYRHRRDWCGPSMRNRLPTICRDRRHSAGPPAIYSTSSHICHWPTGSSGFYANVRPPSDRTAVFCWHYCFLWPAERPACTWGGSWIIDINEYGEHELHNEKLRDHTHLVLTSSGASFDFSCRSRMRSFSLTGSSLRNANPTDFNANKMHSTDFSLIDADKRSRIS